MMLDRFPEVRRGLQEVAKERVESNRIRAERMVRSVPLDQFLSQGLMEAQSLLVLDLREMHALRRLRAGLRRRA